MFIEKSVSVGYFNGKESIESKESIERLKLKLKPTQKQTFRIYEQGYNLQIQGSLRNAYAWRL